MNSNTTGRNAIHIASMGHAAFAVIMIGLGVLGLIKRDFTVVWQGVPNGLPAREALAYLCSLVSLARACSFDGRPHSPLACCSGISFCGFFCGESTACSSCRSSEGRGVAVKRW